MNWFDRLVGTFSPRAALRREATRVQLAEVSRVRARSQKRYHDARRDASWGINTGRVEDAIPRMVLSRQRVRRIVLTNPYAAKVRNALLNNLVGFGITGTPIKGTPKKVAEAWKLWLRHADWMGRCDFYGLQELAVGTTIGDGECFIVRRFDRSRAGVIPTRIQVLDADMLGGGPDGSGIEYDRDGRPSKYHFRERRAGHLSAFSGKAVTFDAKDVIHLFRQDWPGQMRGVSVFEPAIKRFEDFDEYMDAEVVRKKIEACFAAFITPSEDSAAEDFGIGGESDETTANDFDVEVLEPGLVQRLRPGDEVKFGEPKPSAAISEFARVTLLGATAGAGVTYEHGTGDLSNVNYSSYRAGSLEFQRFCGRYQWLTIIPIMLDRIWDWVCEDAYQTGVFSKRYYEMAWTPPAFESIDRKKDAEADALEMANGSTSLRKVVGSKGESFEDQMNEIAEDRKLLDQLGLSDLARPAAKASSKTTTAGDGNTEGKADDASTD
ncbi:MAG TPA: phage portal protein [Novosphingobium sp.]|nr:phage portal protein [Novosphingobium sp.]